MRSRSIERRSRDVRSKSRSSRRRETKSRSPVRMESQSRSISNSNQHERDQSLRESTASAKLTTHARPGDENLLPTYDPAKEDLSIENWVRHVDDLAHRFEWDDRSMMRLIATRLRGHARQWYDTQMRVGTCTWAATKVHLVAQFRRRMLFSRLLREADLYETKPG